MTSLIWMPEPVYADYEIPQSICGTMGLAANRIPLDHEGREIWRQNCMSCHSLNKKVIGPALLNVFERRGSLWIVSLVRNNEKLIQSGNTAAINLFNEYRRIQHTNFEQMLDEKFSILMTYLYLKGKQ